MNPRDARAVSGRKGTAGLWDELQTSFGLPSGLAMLAGVVLGFAFPAIDNLLNLDIPTFSFETQNAASGLLETVASVTVTVAGLALSVTVVAFTLTSSQLSPRVLRTFRSDRLSQTVLALFLGTAIYCLSVLVRLGARDDGDIPDLSITVALLLALVSFVLFAVFIGHLASMLQPSTVIATIVDEAKGTLSGRFPSGIGYEPERVDSARIEAHTRMQRSDPLGVEANDEGYLRLIQGERLIAAANSNDALLRQRVLIGDYVTPGDVLTEVWADDLSEDDREALTAAVRRAFVFGKQRGSVQDISFPIRQLADIALKGLSPGINDPTTAENAMNAMTAVIVHFVRSEQSCEVRVSSDGYPRFVALVPELDDLVRLGFEQVRVFAAPYPVVAVRLLGLLYRIRREARDAGLEHSEVERQAALFCEGPEDKVPTVQDVDRVRQAYADLYRPNG